LEIQVYLAGKSAWPILAREGRIAMVTSVDPCIMRIALALDRFDRDRGGLEHWAWQWARWLVGRGHFVHVIASDGVDDFSSDRFRLSKLGFAPTRTEMAAKVAAYLDTVEADVVHDLGIGWRYDVIQPHFGSRLADDRRNLRSLPLSRRLRSMASRKRRRHLADYRELETRQYVGNRGRVVAISEMTREDLVRWHGISRDKVTVVYNGVDLDKFRPPDPERRAAARRQLGFDERIVLLFAAHNFRLKGLHTTLRALQRMADPRFHLMVAGRGEVDRYSRLARRLGVDDQVTFMGFVADMGSAYGMADAFVHPTFYDPCSLVTLEAAASALPVITSRFSGAAELFRDEESAAIVADPEDAAELQARIGRLVDPQYRARLGSRALAVVRNATADRCFSALLDICREAAEQRASR
jgi:UDP-glucose:(heptosyl)LPS alpha-1,3-glucosyltransferase